MSLAPNKIMPMEIGIMTNMIVTLVFGGQPHMTKNIIPSTEEAIKANMPTERSREPKNIMMSIPG